MKFMTVLLEHGADVDHQDKEGITALHRSCASGHLEAVKLLLRYKAFPNFTDTARCVKNCQGQDSYGSWKTWKGMELTYFRFPGLESHGKL